jgi:outer membrane immunogenic protein
MRRKLIVKKIVVALTAVAAFTGSAMAADMAVKAPAYKAAPPVAIYNWTGFYIGANVGAIGSDGNTTHQCINPAGVLNGLGCDIIPGSGLRGTGVLGGVQAGYNWQSGMWVLGVEGDGQATSLKNSSSLFSPAFPLNGGGFDAPATFTTSARLDWLATARARVGVTSGAALFYVTGGAAFGGVRTATNLFGAPNAYPSTTDSTRSGWTAGGGIEWGFAPQWSAKVEGLYYDLGSVTSLGASVPLITAFREGARYEINGWVARVGVNYRFAGPVVAKY